jgi:acetylornithine deacetylase
MVIAMARLAEDRPKGSASVVLACTVDEEFTHRGSSYLAANRPAADLAIVAEPTRLDLVTTHKGAVRWKVRTRGVACHSSVPHLGVNAIYRMAQVLDALSAYAEALAAAPPDPVLGPPTFSVGRIEGGQSVNVVPDWCEIEVDRRVIPGDDIRQCPAETAAFLARRLGSLDGIEFLPPWITYQPLSSTVPDPWIEAIRSAVQTRIGRAPAVGGVPYGTDAGPLGESGLPCVVIGPGDIAQAHTKDEWIELNEVRAAADCYYDIARALG